MYANHGVVVVQVEAPATALASTPTALEAALVVQTVALGANLNIHIVCVYLYVCVFGCVYVCLRVFTHLLHFEDSFVAVHAF